MEQWTELIGEKLTRGDIYSIRASWTARNASPGQDWQALYSQFQAAQIDLGRMLRFLSAFDGPPLQE